MQAHSQQPNHLGIDHPLVAVRDMDKACQDFARLGFYINPRHHHPWGTDNHLLMFPENFIEVISVYDSSKLDLTNDEGFAFGRFISDSMARKEGIAMVALHSEDARADHRLMDQRGVENQGLVDFRRIAHRPDGSEEEAVVSLVMLINPPCPAMSHFFCHQHKPNLVWVDDWMHHPNGANGITGISYVADHPDEFRSRFEGIYGAEAVTLEADQLVVTTDRGTFEVLTPQLAQTRFHGVDVPANAQQLPSGVAIRVSTCAISQAQAHLDQNQVKYVTIADGGLRIPAHYAGNTIIEIYPD
jgi:hypothetical protein